MIRKLTYLLRNRRVFLCAHPPACAFCAGVGFGSQMQLMEYFSAPSLWRCRTCLHWVEWEPSNFPDKYPPIVERHSISKPKTENE